MPPPNTPEGPFTEDGTRSRSSLLESESSRDATGPRRLLLPPREDMLRRLAMDQPDDLGDTNEPVETEGANEVDEEYTGEEYQASTERTRGAETAHIRPAQCPRPASPLVRERDEQTGVAKLDWRGLEYVGHYDEHLDCAICQSPLIEPKMSKCLHSFCRECFDQMLLEDDRCPLDRKPFERFENGPGSVFYCPAPPMVVSLLDNLQVRCPNTRCDYVCARSLIEHHYTKDCPFTRVPCPDNTCRKFVARYGAEGGRCMHKSIECDYCSKPVDLAGLEDHYDSSCEQTQITCQSCLTAIPKYRYGTHVASCPDRLVDCQYKTSGCTSVVKKKDAAEHERVCLHGMIVRMQRVHDSDMEAMKAALSESRDHVQQLEFELAARPPIGQEWALSVPQTQTQPPQMGTTAPGTPSMGLPQPALQPLPPIAAIPPMNYGAVPVPGGPVVASGSGDQPGTPPSDPTIIRQTDGLNADDKINHLLTDFEAFNARMEILERYVGGVDTRHALHTMNELAPIREQIVDLYNNLGLMNMHVRRMTESFRQTMTNAGGGGGVGGEVGEAPTAPAGPAATAMNAMATAIALKQDAMRRSFFAGPVFPGPVFPGRRLSDRENPPRL